LAKQVIDERLSGYYNNAHRDVGLGGLLRDEVTQGLLPVYLTVVSGLINRSVWARRHGRTARKCRSKGAFQNAAPLRSLDPRVLASF
jgi:hypothetical protein